MFVKSRGGAVKEGSRRGTSRTRFEGGGPLTIIGGLQPICKRISVIIFLQQSTFALTEKPTTSDIQRTAEKERRLKLQKKAKSNKW